MAFLGSQIKQAKKALRIKEETGQFELGLREHAMYSPDEFKRAPIKELLRGKTLTFLGGGFNARVYKMEGEDWVIKEGKWDMKVDIRLLKLPLPAVLLERVANLFSFFFLPRTKTIISQYRDYLAFAGYFGYFATEQDYYHPNRAVIFNLQRNIRDSLIQYVPQVEAKYGLKLREEVLAILDSPVKYHNFLPQEYLLIGDSISKENNGKETYFIIQKYIAGTLMYKYDLEQAPKEVKQQLILFAYLQLLMSAQIDMIPDTRPTTPFDTFNWLTKTDNIVVTEKQGLIFIDTRWMWRVNSNVISRGFLIPELAINQAKDLMANFEV